MADHSVARWKTVMYTLGEKMKKPEYRRFPSVALTKFRKYNELLMDTEDANSKLKEKKSDQSTIEIILMNKQAISTGSARAYNHAGNKGDSRKKTVSFSTVTADFSYSLKQADRVIWKEAELISGGLWSAVNALHDSIEATLLASINTNKSQVVQSATPVGGVWDGTNHIFGVESGNEDVFMQKIKGFMRQQKYDGGMYEAIFDEYAYQVAEKVLQQGGGNSENLAWQGMGIDALVSQGITAATGYNSMGYIWTPGTIGLLDWIPSLNKQGFGDTFKEGGFYYSIPDPFGSGLTFAVHERAVAADNQSTSGERQDIDIHVELSVDLSEVFATTSVANESTVFKFGLKQ